MTNTMDELEIYKKIQKSPRLFVEMMWGLTTERDNDKFVKGKHYTWQQDDMLKAVEKSVNGGKKKIAIKAGRGVGKAQPHSLEIDTPQGKTKFGDLKLGDTVFGSDGKPTEVIGIFEQGVLPIYKVTFDDGSSTLCNDEHLWNVKGMQERRKNLGWSTLTLREIMKKGVKRPSGINRMDRQWEIPNSPVSNFNSKKIDLDPYTLGVWLGDGARKKNQITSADNEVVEQISLKYKVEKEKYNDYGYKIEGLLVKLKKLKISDKYSYEKYIPENYKYNSVKVRWEILRGLLDTDGNINKEGIIQFDSTSEQLVKDVIWLARSLGFKARQNKTKKTYYKKDGKQVNYRDSYRTTLTPPLESICFYIKRKQERILKHRQDRYLKKFIESVEYVGDDNCRCISVVNQDGLYLTNDFIVTHNTATMVWIILWFLFANKDAQVAVTAPSQQQLFDVLWKEVSLWLQKMPPNIRDKYEWSSSYIRIKESPNTWFASAKTARKENPEVLSGLHGENIMVIADEASAIDSLIFEMAEGAGTSANFIEILISNPTRTYGYFYEIFKKKREKWNTMSFSGLDAPESIVDREYINEILEDNGENSDTYKVSVLGEFPDEGVADEKGYVPLLSKDDLMYIDKVSPDSFMGKVYMGVDPSGEGDDETVWVVRDNFKAMIVAKERKSTSKTIAAKTLTLMDYYNIPPENVMIDNFGEGADVGKEIALSIRQYDVGTVNVGDASKDEEMLNLRSEGFMKVRDWIKHKGELCQDDGWEELLNIRYRRNIKGRVQIMPKVEMKKQGMESPNCADAFMLTFLCDGSEKKDDVVFTRVPRRHYSTMTHRMK